MVNFTEAEKYSATSYQTEEDEIDKEIAGNLDRQFEEEMVMSMHEKGLNSF